ncbi:class I SAM-dependent methyltransferase [Kribbella antibiotica]|uniref:Class I SAM-dependent methyltransferase n=1 Tax=Kribbella antibiotica TaxID=190195 RepID=A0A4R4ZS41_9ACTN|nr:cyclopropane-fatty-acyl-phospholipid synthase family protein [Kribbella antibiotica]TDD61605.1 class I SAM-dependent methyltransferase [Kribbella antibiotica]
MSISQATDRTSTVIDSARWPRVARVPQYPVRAAVARQIFNQATRQLPVAVQLPGRARTGTGPVFEVVSDRFFDRLGKDLKVGFGESYMAGEWRAGDGTDLADLLTVFARQLAELVPGGLQRLRRLVDQPIARLNDRVGARSNISHHYDLSNELFATFLDPTMSYSSALFDSSDEEPLAVAQRRKIDNILDLAGVTAGARVLEIGTGWGQLAIQAAQRGAEVHSITLSAEQRDLARKRISEAGVHAEVELCDYRDVQGRYDAIVSVEMIEAVGEQYWPEYFATVADRLEPGGRFGLQSITMAHDRLLTTRNSQSWIHEYIFPGGLIPSVEVIRTMGAAAGLDVAAQQDFGADYARTLRLWRERFTASSERVDGLGFDEVFRRMWEFYLAYSEAGFRSGYLNVAQFALTRSS